MDDIEVLANEYEVYMAFLGFLEEEIVPTEEGFDIEPSSKFMYEANREERQMNNELIDALKSNKGFNAVEVRRKLEDFKKETIYMVQPRKTLSDFQDFLDTYYTEQDENLTFLEAMENYTDEDKEDINRRLREMYGEEITGIDFANQRERAMLRPRIQELLEPEGKYGEYTQEILDIMKTQEQDYKNFKRKEIEQKVEMLQQEARTLEAERERAMFRVHFEEMLEPKAHYGEQMKQVKDWSNRYGANMQPTSMSRIEYFATGVGTHTSVGEANARALLTDAQAQEILRRYWAGKRGGGTKITQRQLAKEYGLSSQGSIAGIINRTNWVHLPRVPYEPDSHYLKRSKREKKSMKKAKEEGVELILNKEGRLRLPDEIILKQRKPKKEKKVKE